MSANQCDLLQVIAKGRETFVDNVKDMCYYLPGWTEEQLHNNPNEAYSLLLEEAKETTMTLPNQGIILLLNENDNDDNYVSLFIEPRKRPWSIAEVFKRFDDFQYHRLDKSESDLANHFKFIDDLSTDRIRVIYATCT